MSEKEKTKLVRKTAQVPRYVAEWIEERSEETGLSQSSIMLLAINQYMDQQKSLNMGDAFKEMKKMLEEKGKK